MISTFYDRVVVKIQYDDKVGSGVIFSLRDNSYLISAYHIFDLKDDIECEKIHTSRQVAGRMKNLSIKILQYFIYQDKDIILFKLEKSKEVPKLCMANIRDTDKAVVVGYPNVLDNSQNDILRYILRGEVNEILENNTIMITSNVSLETMEKGASDVISGYSGSGIFIEKGEQAYLVGIVLKLLTPDGALSTIIGKLITEIDEDFYYAVGEHIPNFKWESFSEVKDSTLEIFDGKLLRMAKSKVPSIVNNIVPSSIIKKCGNKVVWPNSEKGLNEDKVWETWLIYLIFRCIENEKNIDGENYYLIGTKKNIRKAKVLYDMKNIVLADFFQDYSRNAYMNIEKAEVIIIGTRRVPTRKELSKKMISNIVKDITTSMENEGLFIDDVNSNMQGISVIHINKLIDEVSRVVEKFEDKLSYERLEKKVAKKIKEVFDEV